MRVSLPLEKMTQLDKLAIMEKLWNDLCQDPESVPSPDWHQEVLDAREKAVDQGRAQFEPFASAKEKIRAQVK